MFNFKNNLTVKLSPPAPTFRPHQTPLRKTLLKIIIKIFFEDDNDGGCL